MWMSARVETLPKYRRIGILSASAFVALLLLQAVASSYAADQDVLDTSAADSSQNAPVLVDSRFMVWAARRCSASLSSAQDTLRATGRPDVKGVALGVAMNCKRLGLTLASLARQKGWTLPPPESPLYGPMRAEFSDSTYLARHERPVLQRELNSITVIAANL